MDRPKVVVYGEASVDGRITIAPGVLLMFPEPRWQAVAPESGTYKKLKQMHQPQSYLEGSLSLMPEGTEPAPLPPVEGETAWLYEDYLPDSIVKRPDRVGWFTVIDGRGRIRWLYKEFPDEEWKGWLLLVLVNRSTPAEYLAYLRREEIAYLVAGDGPKVDLPCALAKLRGQLGVERLLSTSPGKIGGALLRAGLVDEIDIDFFPAVIGGFNTPSLFESPDLGPEEMPARLRLLSCETSESGRVWLRYEVLRQEG